MRCLIFSAEFDLSNDRLITRLQSRGHQVYRVNYAGAMPELAYDPVTGVLSIERDGERFDGSDFDCFWSRGLPFPSLHQTVESALVQQERHAWLEAVMLELPQTAWLNPPRAMRAAHSKARQLRLAAKVGLNVPATRFISRASADDMVGDVVFKSLTGGLLSADGSICSIPTLSGEQLSLISGGALNAPCIAQARVLGRDVRVFWIDGHTIAVAIDTPEGSADWRVHPDEDLGAGAIETPASVANATQALMEGLNCRVAALDFVVDSDGRWWFLEANIMGSWIWFEEKAGVPVTDAVCDALVWTAERA